MELPQALKLVTMTPEARDYTHCMQGSDLPPFLDMSTLRPLHGTSSITNKQVYTELHLKQLISAGIAEAVSLLTHRPGLLEPNARIPLIGVKCDNDPRNVIIRLADGQLVLDVERCTRSHAKHVWQIDPWLTFIGVSSA